MISVTDERSLHDLYIAERESLTLVDVDPKVYAQIRGVVAALEDDAGLRQGLDPDGIMTQGAVDRFRRARNDARDLMAIRLRKIADAAERDATGHPSVDIDPLPMEDIRLYNGVKQATQRYLEEVETGLMWVDGRQVVIP